MLQRAWTAKNLVQPMEALERHGVFARIMMGLAKEAPDNKTISIDAT